jgi:predicted amidophosphoribosyltransferase
MIRALLRILYPETCPVCEEQPSEHDTAPLCSSCWQTITPYNGPFCNTCGKPLSSDVSITCSDCLNDEPAFSTARSFGLYEGTLRDAVHLFKFHGKRRKKRLRSREFNQSALLARHLSRHTGIPPLYNSLVKVRDTSPQVGLRAKERRKNLKNAFRVTDKESIRGKDLLLVDDVFTTGATIRECSRLLRKEGSGKIYAALLAHSRGD